MADPAHSVPANHGVDVVSVKVAWAADVAEAARLVRERARSLGFPPDHCEELHLVVTELASNLIRHAAHGTIRFSTIETGGRSGIEIESEDDGPGIADVELAMTDGFSTADSLGTGLGTINRLMDDLEFASGPSAGLRIVCRRWVRPKPCALPARELVFGIATRSCRLQPENGDSFLVQHWERNALAGIIDGLGHGEHARRASQTARRYVEQHFDQPLRNIFRGTDRACRATRGVVMALARFDMAGRKVTLANVGNVEVRLIGCPERPNILVRRGVIGLNAPAAVSTEHPWSDSCVLVMHSDGLRPNWNWSDFSSLANDAPDIIARRLLNTLGKIDDDATVLVARSARG